MKPTLAVSVLDSVGKKCRFMQFAKSHLALKNLSVVNTRLETFNTYFHGANGAQIISFIPFYNQFKVTN
jgi:16S rRNA G527 N7-methylase RsmG